MEYQYATICEAIADAIPDRIAIVNGARRITWADYERRSACLASALAEAGVGPGSKVGLFLYNGLEYAEGQFAAFKLRAVPINVNYRYLADEVVHVLEDCDAEVVIYHASLAERIADAREDATRVRMWIEVDDGGAGGDGAEDYEELIAVNTPAPRIARSDDDEFILYTGGTTGMPKGVVYRMASMMEMLLTKLPAMVGLAPVASPAEAVKQAPRLWEDGAAYAALPACPLMHGTGNLIGLLAPHLLGGTSVLLEGRSLDAAEVWTMVEQEGVRTMVIVGDPFAKPLLRALGEGGGYHLDHFKYLISSGAMLSAETKRALLDALPHLTITDAIGASEGFMAMDTSVAGTSSQTARFMPLPTTKVFTDDDREVVPGSEEVGLVAVGGNVPLGYYKDERKTAMTFREIGGTLYSFPGDMAKLAADGSLLLLGRGSQCVTTGGEKVFPEEVEEVVKQHPAVDDCLVVGLADEQYGQRVAAVVAVLVGQQVSEDDLVEHVRGKLARYKAPREILFADSVPRTPSGKPDYANARALFARAASTES
jgi:acyl-CoA synthetase (AMP-forming)/AMP-acid ligase II